MKWEIFAKVNEFRTEMEVLIFKVKIESTFFRKRQPGFSNFSDFSKFFYRYPWDEQLKTNNYYIYNI